MSHICCMTPVSTVPSASMDLPHRSLSVPVHLMLSHSLNAMYYIFVHAGTLRLRLHWSQNQHNTTVWTDSRKGSKNEPFRCWHQQLQWIRSDRRVVFQQLPTVWPNKIYSFRACSLVKYSAIILWFECCCSGQNYSGRTCDRLAASLGLEKTRRTITDVSHRNFGMKRKRN